MALGFGDIPVRFFIYTDDETITGLEDGEVDIVEVTERKFLDAEGPIEYERHTVFDNGCRQICLTKRNGWEF